MPTLTPPTAAFNDLAATAHLAEALPALVNALVSLASGQPTTRERWVAAGTLTVGKGANVRPMFPDLPADQLVLVSRDTTTTKPDRRALFFLLELILGKPTDTHADVTASTPQPATADEPTQPKIETATQPEIEDPHYSSPVNSSASLRLSPTPSTSYLPPKIICVPSVP